MRAADYQPDVPRETLSPDGFSSEHFQICKTENVNFRTEETLLSLFKETKPDKDITRKKKCRKSFLTPIEAKSSNVVYPIQGHVGKIILHSYGQMG